jgi:hypothetical protein
MNLKIAENRSFLTLWMHACAVHDFGPACLLVYPVKLPYELCM